MKRTRRERSLVLALIFLFSGVSVANQATLVSIGVLPFQDESGSLVPPDLLAKLARDIARKINLTHEEMLVRVIAAGSESAGLSLDQLAALGKQQGIRFILRGGILVLDSEKIEKTLNCRVGLYAELIAVENGIVSSLRANGAGTEENAAIDDVRHWEGYDFGSDAFSATALGRALLAAVDQLVPGISQAVQSPVRETGKVEPADKPSAEPAADPAAASYEADQELQQLITQAESLAASGASAGMDISPLQRALESLQGALNAKVSLLEQGQDTAAADQEIARRKSDLQKIVESLTQDLAAAPSPTEPQAVSGEKKNIIQKIGGLLDDALAAVQKIQEIKSALQGAQEAQAAAEPPIANEPAAPVEEPATDVSGVVVDDSGAPVEGAVVTDPQSGAEATTDSSGSYLIPRIPSQRIAELIILKEGRQLSSRKIQLLAGRPAFADWRIGTSGGPGFSGMNILPSTVVLAQKAGGQKAEMGTVTGTARDEQGRPVARAVVMIQGVGVARTDSQGRYSFYNVPQGSYKILIQKGGATVQSLQIVVAGKKIVENRILVAGKTPVRPSVIPAILAKGSGTLLRGTVISEERRALGGAKITAVLRGGGGLSVFSAGNGIYEFRDLKPGSYRLLANKAGFQETSLPFVLQAGHPGVANFILKKTSPQLQKVIAATSPRLTGVQPASVAASGHVNGQVLDAGNRKPVAEAIVQAAGRPAVRADSQGKYRLNNLPPGSYRISAGHSDYQPANKTVIVRAGETSQEVFFLKRKETPRLDATPKISMSRVPLTLGHVRGRVTDVKTGKPIAQATVALANRTAQSNASGDYVLANVTAGSYTVTFKKTGYQDGSSRVTVAAGKTATANIRLTPKVLIEIKKK